jgi:hypothetical protein
MDLDFGPTRDLFVAAEGESWMQPYWQLGIGKRPAEELYRLETDPHQIENLAGQPEFARVQQGLRKRLLEELRLKQDPRVIPPGDAFDRPPYCKGL